MKFQTTITSPMLRRAVLSLVFVSSLATLPGCTSFIKAKAKKETMPKEFSCGEPLPGRPGRVQTEYQMPR